MLYKGFNLTGGNSLYSNWPSTGPVSGTNYQFVTNADIDHIVSKGANAVRLLFAWEAIQPIPKVALPTTASAAFTYWTKLRALADYATSKGLTVLLDIHGDGVFADYRGTKVGGVYAGVPVSDALADLWGKLAAVFKGNPKIAYGLTNEPTGVAVDVWFAAAQKCISAIRAAGANQLIAVPGVNWTHAVSWVSSGSGAAFMKLVDPANNLCAQVHEYANADAGGGTNDIVSETILVERLKPAVEWAKATGQRLWLTEVGLRGDDPKSKACWANLIAYLRANEPNVIGWLWWAYGPHLDNGAWYTKYRFAANSAVTALTPDSPQMDLIEAELAKVEDPVAALKVKVAELEAQVAKLTADAAAASQTIADRDVVIAAMTAAATTQTAENYKLRQALASIALTVQGAL